MITVSKADMTPAKGTPECVLEQNAKREKL